MNGAELDTRRRLLGLSVEELAVVGGVAERTARKWLSGGYVVPDDVPDALAAIERIMERHVNRIVETAIENSEAGPIPLYRFRNRDDLANSLHGADLPVGAHAMTIAWAAAALTAEGIGARIEWAD